VSLLAHDAIIYIAGHKGMAGSAIWRRLQALGYRNIVGYSSKEVDLRNRDAAFDALKSSQPNVLVLAAARVGGIAANMGDPIAFLNDNLLIQTNVFEAADDAGVDRLLFIGSSCVYPRTARQPLLESSLLLGPPEASNLSYAVAKIAGLIAVEAYRYQMERRWISCMPTNLYGPYDNFDLETSHVLPGIMRRLHDAKVSGAESIALWGSGNPRREFMHVDDFARASVLLLEVYDSPGHVNVGVGHDVQVSTLAQMCAEVVNFQGRINWDSSKPDGMPRKLLNVDRLSSLGFTAAVPLERGLKDTYSWYLANVACGEGMTENVP
jgi:GDP-L-fucose synthase